MSLPSAEQKTLGIPIRTIPQRRKMLGIPFPLEKNRSKLSEFRFDGAGFFVKLIFFMPFSSVPSLGIDSSVNLGMPRNEHFLPRITEAIPSLFRGTKFRCQPYPLLPPRSPRVQIKPFSLFPKEGFLKFDINQVWHFK